MMEREELPEIAVMLNGDELEILCDLLQVSLSRAFAGWEESDAAWVAALYHEEIVLLVKLMSIARPNITIEIVVELLTKLRAAVEPLRIGLDEWEDRARQLSREANGRK